MIEESIIKSINDVKFSRDEFAYLSATSKIELPYRDKLSWNLQSQLDNSSINAIREWKRTDIAIIEQDRPLALIELKAMYSFDALNANLKKFSSYLDRDEHKMRNLADNSTEKYLALLVTHPCNKIKPTYKSMVKYTQGINAAIKRHESTESVLILAKEAITSEIVTGNRTLILQKDYQAGTAFDVDFTISLWLLKCN